MLEENRDKEKPRPAREKAQENEQGQTISQKPAGDRHDLEGNRRETLKEDNCPAPLRIKKAQLINTRAIAVEIDQPFPDRLEQKRADRIAKQSTRDRTDRADQRIDPSALGPRERHRDQNRIRRHREKRTLRKGDGTERPGGMLALREA